MVLYAMGIRMAQLVISSLVDSTVTSPASDLYALIVLAARPITVVLLALQVLQTVI
jgi:TRAP-type C4-dicarboxylate transport system permease small subunit